MNTASLPLMGPGFVSSQTVHPGWIEVNYLRAPAEQRPEPLTCGDLADWLRSKTIVECRDGWDAPDGLFGLSVVVEDDLVQAVNLSFFFDTELDPRKWAVIPEELISSLGFTMFREDRALGILPYIAGSLACELWEARQRSAL